MIHCNTTEMTYYQYSTVLKKEPKKQKINNFFLVAFNSLTANEEILQLIMQSLNGDATAQRILISLGRALIDTLLSIRVITLNQATRLYSLFDQVVIPTPTTPLPGG